MHIACPSADENPTFKAILKEITKDVVRINRNAPGMNVVAFTFANEAHLDSVIDREVDYLQPLNQPFTWKVYDHDRLPSLKGKLVSRGFQEDGDPADVMVLDVKNLRSYYSLSLGTSGA